MTKIWYPAVYHDNNIKGNKTESEIQNYTIISDMNGNIILPDEVKKKMGLEAGSSFQMVVHKDRIEVYPNIHSLAKVYIEPTTLCNLSCRTCIRETWKEPLGSMDINVFDMIVEQLKDFNELDTIMIGGFGEPTFHKDILYMIGRLKSLGVKVEMVTNGTLLDENMINGLIENGLDTLWVSFDGTSADCFEDIREGAGFDAVVNNLRSLRQINGHKDRHKITLGIAFVVMKNNINELQKINSFADKIGAKMISVSNVIPYQKDMVEQMVCNLGAPHSIPISLPMIEVTGNTKEALYKMFQVNTNISVMRNKIGTASESCRFIKERCSFIRWDGKVAPCMGLIHSHSTYYQCNHSKREVIGYTLGDLEINNLKDIWNSQEYHDFRNKVDLFEFSPCLNCYPCELAEKNLEDCFGNTFPTCGGCLWAQGVIQCP